VRVRGWSVEGACVAVRIMSGSMSYFFELAGKCLNISSTRLMRSPFMGARLLPK